MKIIIFLNILFIQTSMLYGQSEKSIIKNSSIPIKINWVTNIKGNFSFKNKWTYPEGIDKNKFGQLSCDGFCESDVESMIDSNGRIYKDSLKAYYKIVDTSYQYYTLSCNAWCYEFGEANFIEAIRKSVDTVSCFTLLNASTHCNLQLQIVNGVCYAIIDLRSVFKGGDVKYYCNKGYIDIDKNYWDKGIIKASFGFYFEHTENPKKPIYWIGKMYTAISNPENIQK